MSEICIITQTGEEGQYRDYFKRLDSEMVKSYRGKDWAILESEKLGAFGERLHFAEQHSPEGFGHAVYQAREFVGDEPFLLLLGDHVYISNVKDRCACDSSSRYLSSTCSTPCTGVQPTVERLLHLFGTIRGQPIDAEQGDLQGRVDHRKAIDRRSSGKSAFHAGPAGGKLSFAFRACTFFRRGFLIRLNI